MSHPNPSVSILIPTYNEKRNITPLCHALLNIFQLRKFEIIVIDDDSPDGTADEVKAISQADDRLRLLLRKGQRGLVSAIREGFEMAQGEIIVRIDADFIISAEEIESLVRGVEQGSDMTFASRYVVGGDDIRTKKIRSVMSWWVNKICQWVISSKYKDYTSCLFAAKRRVMEQIPLEGYYGEFFIAFLTKVSEGGFVVKEIPYQCQSRTYGYSKSMSGFTNSMSNGLRYIAMIFKTALSRRRIYDRKL